MFLKDVQLWNKFVIKAEDEIKIKDLLIDELGFSIRSISKMKRQESIFVNGKLKKPTSVAKNGDVIEILINEEKSEFIPQKLPVECIYEDFDLMVVNKPPFMVVHPTKSHFENTLANYAAYHIEEKNENVRIRFVNRLDMNTSGIVIIAKNAYAHHKISVSMSENEVDKIYLAIVDGVMENDRGTIDKPIYRESEDSITRCIDDRGQKSITHYEVVQRMEKSTLVKLKLETGRTHQIRVHLSSIGHGIIGDELYGYVDEKLISRQALHAYKIGFNQPRLNDRIDLNCNLPKDMIDLIEKLGGDINEYKL